MPASATLFLMVGLPGSGKTTLARRLEVERSALRFTPDEWMKPLYGDDIDQAELDHRRTPVESMQWAVAERALALGVNVILDWGFWSRREREDFRDRAAAIGARSEIRLLDIPRDVLWSRLAARNANLPPGMFHISEQQLDLWGGWFERPGPDELEPRR